MSDLEFVKKEDAMEILSRCLDLAIEKEHAFTLYNIPSGGLAYEDRVKLVVVLCLEIFHSILRQMR